MTLKDIAKLCNVFYIGGTKTGAMFGEAVVFSNMKVPHFFTTIKQNGGVLHEPADMCLTLPPRH